MLGLQKGIIYGPVNSRRLGRSLGINLSPIKYKLCTFDCLYCQYGWTKIHGRTVEYPGLLPALPDVLQAIEASLSHLSPKPDYITFSGNGEPTLHPRFGEIVDGVIELRDRLSPQSRTAVLSNSATADEPKVSNAIAKLDVKIMKLDCGTEECFLTYNRPCEGSTLEKIVRGLTAIPAVTIQTLFTAGQAGNYTEHNLEAWMRLLRKIHPIAVQIYTLDRGYPSKEIDPLTNDQLIHVQDELAKEGTNAAAYPSRRQVQK
ncbi:MAG: radical SAM protein [Calditrichia bacterium]